MLLLLIIGLVGVASGALVQVSATAVKDVVNLAIALWLSFAAFDTTYLATLARLFVRGSIWRPSLLNWFALSFESRVCVIATTAFAGNSLETGPEVEAYKNSAPSPRFQNPCRSAPVWVSLHPVQHTVSDISGCVGAGCGNVAEHSICRVFHGHLRLTCVEMYNIFRRLNKVYYKLLHIGCFKSCYLINLQVKVCRQKLSRRSNSNRYCKSLLWFHRPWCRWTYALSNDYLLNCCCVLYFSIMNFC